MRVPGGEGKTNDRNVLYLVAAMLFFWAICDSIMSFIAPLIMVERGMSATMMGLIIGTSSIAGALFDFILARILPSTNFRRVFALLLILSASFPLIVWHGSALWMFLVAMGIWGLYFDLYRFGLYDFVTRLPQSETYASYFGHIQVFIALGVLIAPFIAGFLIGEAVGTSPLVAALIFLGLAGLVYYALLAVTRSSSRYTDNRPREVMGLFRELRTWRRLGTTMLPILIISLTLSMINAFYWTIGPLFADSFESLGKFSGLFLASFLAPSLIVGWFVGDITARYGQQRTALGALFFGSLILVSLAVVADEFVILGINLFASFFLAAAYPAINGVYANFIAETPRLEADIEAVEDSSTNMGWVFGPILAGLISDTVGYHYTFVILGIIGMTVAFFVWRIMPRRIHVTPR